MTDTKKHLLRSRNPDKDQGPIPFDDALRRLVNTPPKPKKSSGPKKQRRKAQHKKPR